MLQFDSHFLAPPFEVIHDKRPLPRVLCTFSAVRGCTQNQNWILVPFHYRSLCTIILPLPVTSTISAKVVPLWVSHSPAALEDDPFFHIARRFSLSNMAQFVENTIVRSPAMSLNSRKTKVRAKGLLVL